MGHMDKNAPNYINYSEENSFVKWFNSKMPFDDMKINCYLYLIALLQRLHLNNTGELRDRLTFGECEIMFRSCIDAEPGMPSNCYFKILLMYSNYASE